MNFLTYLSWNDVGTNKKYIVYSRNGQMVGIECKYFLLNKESLCSFCHRHGQVAFITTITKARKLNNPDYYKAIGNYVCFDSSTCNQHMTSVEVLESFLEKSLKES